MKGHTNSTPSCGHCGVRPMCSTFVLVLVAQPVKAQAVLRLGVDQRRQFSLEGDVLCGVQQALEHGILHSLAMVDADFCDLNASRRRPAGVSVFTS